MDAFLSSFGFVAAAEMGDKTQLLALFLAARFRRPWPICAGIFAATVANHLLAGVVGVTVARHIDLEYLKWGLGLSFIAMGLWALVPDKPTSGAGIEATGGGVFVTTLIAFFLAEMGDKTQLVTVALAARFNSLLAVASGTTVGMLLADVPVAFLGERLTRKVPAKTMRLVVAALFSGFGLAILLGW